MEYCLVTKSHPINCSMWGFPLSPGIGSNSCPLTQWHHPTISFSVTSFFSCLQSVPTLGSFPESVLRIRWPKYWNFSISPSYKYLGLISFRTDCFDLQTSQSYRKSILNSEHEVKWSHSVMSDSLWPHGL